MRRRVISRTFSSKRIGHKIFPTRSHESSIAHTAVSSQEQPPNRGSTGATLPTLLYTLSSTEQRDTPLPVKRLSSSDITVIVTAMHPHSIKHHAISPTAIDVSEHSFIEHFSLESRIDDTTDPIQRRPIGTIVGPRRISSRCSLRAGPSHRCSPRLRQGYWTLHGLRSVRRGWIPSRPRNSTTLF